MTSAQVLDRFRRRWVAGLTIYVLLGVVLGAIMPFLLPWLGGVVIVGCSTGQDANRRVNETLILIAAGIEAVCGLLLILFVSGNKRTALDGAISETAFYASLLIPLLVGAYALTRPRVAGTPGS